MRGDKVYLDPLTRSFMYVSGICLGQVAKDMRGVAQIRGRPKTKSTDADGQ
jgi:hypothetical protein